MNTFHAQWWNKCPAPPCFTPVLVTMILMSALDVSAITDAHIPPGIIQKSALPLAIIAPACTLEAAVITTAAGTAVGGPYTLGDSSGQTCAGIATSSTYGIEEGFWRNVATPPTAGTLSPISVTNEPSTILISTLLATFSTPEGDPLSLLSMDAKTIQGGSITLNDLWIIYRPPDDFKGTDSFKFTICDANGNTATATLSMLKVTLPATITLHPLIQLYDGSEKQVSATTAPTGLDVDITYNGLSSMPINTGAYTVIGTIHDTTYHGCATNILRITTKPQIRTISSPNPNVLLTWSSMDGLSYQLQYTTDLNPADWLDLGNPVTAVGPTTITTAATLSSATSRFYRIKLLLP